MASASRSVAVLTCAILQLFIRYARASQIAAFTNGGYKVPQVIMYDGASDSILYSLCNSQDTPVFPGDKSAAFELQPQFPPYPGTHVSVIGYTDGKGIKTKDGHIVEALFECNETGHYKPVEGNKAFKLTDVSDIPKPKAPTDLTALLLGDEGGIRLYYKEDTNSSISSIKYKPKEKQRWVAAGPAQPYSSVGSHAAGFAITDKIHLITPTSNEYGELVDVFLSTTLPDDESIWDINAVPFPLIARNLSDQGMPIPVILSNMTYSEDKYEISFDTDHNPGWGFDALDPLNAPLGLTFGAGETMSIFYVGKDKQLRQVRREQQDGGKSFKWSNATRPNAKAWPAPDDTSAHFGVAYDTQADHIWVYYMSNRTMTQLYQPSKGQWEDSAALPKSSDGHHSSGGGLSKGTKLGIGIGVGLGLPLLLAVIAAYIFFHSRSSRKNRAAENAAMQDAHSAAIAPPSHPGSPAPRYTSGYWQAPPGHQPHNGPWPQHQPGVPYSDHNGYIKPEAGYGWGNGGTMDQKLQQQQQQQPPFMQHHSPPPQAQPVFEMSNNQVSPPPQEMPGETTTTATATTTEVPGPHAK
ncbi:hypothetical protein PG996_009086 [Apiospora saccharicola]|uniref:Fucose-specific lectin n=1 Tax=Apiospora saccharicola TaxID=335842 RepID=A0ABR1UJR0_9PEZI